MSLIVARRFNDSITVVSDTRITHPSHIKVDHISGAVIKTVALTPTFSLSFAGDENFAGKTIVAAFHWQQLDQDEIVKKLLAKHLESNDSTPTDFIVAFHKPTRLVVIKDGAATDTYSGWVGAGFNCFQCAMLQDRNGPWGPSSKDRLSLWHHTVIEPSSEGSPEGLPGKMLRAMQEVIDDPDESTVGGLPVILVTQKNSFCYGEHVMFTGGLQSYDEFLEGGRLARQDAGTGSCTVYCTSAQVGYLIFPVIYFLEPQLGLIFRESKNGTLHSKGIRSQSFDLLLWTMRDELRCRVASHLPNAEELRRHSEIFLQEMFTSEKGGEGIDKGRNIEAMNFVIAAKPCLKTTKVTVQVCEPAVAPASTVFLHLKSGQRMSYMDIFRSEVIKQSRVHRLATGRTIDAMAYLQYAPPFGDDRYVIEGNSGIVDLTFLVIHGEVTSMAS